MKTYYEILEISTDATEIEIKKAYRRLALQHHPDRNNGSLESTERFKEIGEAYDCLSDPIKKYDYDNSLKHQRRGNVSSSSSSSQQHVYTGPKVSPMSSSRNGRWTSSSPRYYDDFDAFAQFDRHFGHDPFFQEAFRDMDEEFARRFQQQQNQKGQQKSTSTNTSSKQQQQHTTVATTKTHHVKSKEGWIPWLLRQCGIEFQMTSYVSNGRGGMTATHYSTSPNHHQSSSSSSKSSYQQKQTSIYHDAQGRQVRIQSMEKNGNQIEDMYVNNRLVQRKVNGIVEKPIERLRT